MKKLFNNYRILPKMAVMLIDLAIIILAFSISFLLIPPVWFTGLIQKYFLIYLALYAAISSVVFYIMKIPKSIMRYSNIPDLFKLFAAVLVTSAVFDGVVQLTLLFYKIPAIVQSFLVINIAISGMGLIMFRICIKGVFAQLKKLPVYYKDVVVIYGADKRSVIIKQAIESSGKFHVAGFLEDSPHKVNKSIEQRKVFSFDSLIKIKEQRKINTLFITNDDVKDRLKRVVIEKCIDNGIKVVKIPYADNLTNGEINIDQISTLSIDDLLQREAIVISTDNILKQTANKRILITGAGGSIGSEIVRQILKFNPQQVILCDKSESPLHDLQMELEDNYPGVNVKLMIADIQNPDRMRTLFRDTTPQIVFHTAAYKHVPLMEHNPSEAVLVNIGGTKNLADLAVEYHAEKFVMISTDKAINPTNVMGATKRVAELYIQSLHYKNCGTKFITTRFGNVLGSNGSVIPRFKKQIEQGGPVTVTHPEITRYFMTITEAAQLVMEASAIGNGGEILIFDMGEPVKIIDLARKMISMSGTIPDVDIKIVFSGLRPGEKLHEELLKADEWSVPSHHSKIKILFAGENQWCGIDKHIADLMLLVKSSDIDIVKKIKEVVPEFISNNSVYEVLDAENKKYAYHL